ncbi:Lipopolysaccharide export system ATP-binding protein LptB [archaeon HR01]|nr:Lipopolysaccharide export system ATP-binding protein LptB [archaeon HR01]
MLVVRDLVAGYGDIPIVRGVSLEARKDEITSIIGPNGAGKSTLLKAVFNLIKPKGGRVLIDGVDVTGLPPHKLVSLGVSFLMQRRTIFPELTVEENLEMALWKMRRNLTNRRERLERVYELFPAIARLRGRPAYLLSGGEQRQVELARVFLQEPKIVLVDEPTVGLSPKAAYGIYEMLTMMKGEVAVLMVDQNIRYASQFSDKLYVMVNGVITMEGSGETLSSSLKEIVKSWLRYT